MQSALAEMGDRLATIDIGRKDGELLYPFRGSWIPNPHEHNVARAEAYLRTKWHLDPSSRLATKDMGKIGGCAPFWGRGLGPHLTQRGQGRGLPPHQVAS